MDIFKQLELIKQQNEREDAIRDAMLEILELSEVEEDEIPQNFNLGTSIRVLMKNEKGVFSAIQKSDLNYVEIGEYLCFKVDDELSGTEDVYFVSPTEVLYLESGNLIVI